MFVAQYFLSDIINEYGKSQVSTDSVGTWYPLQAFRFFKLKHHLHSNHEKSIIERTMQFVKDRTESFADYFPCRKKNCKLKHVKQLLDLFVFYYNRNIES